jgi:glycosyltransferase involved in cell wall biosynthesis
VVIAFCTCAMNRLWQVECTLPENLALLRGTRHFVALCNYNSSDGLDDFVRLRFRDDCRKGHLLYFRTVTPQSFHASKAKNTAHRLALERQPDVVFNLDADNFITDSTLVQALDTFARTRSVVLHQWSRTWGDGSFGRIAARSPDWTRLGGYDETLREMTWQDVDLLNRARAMGFEYELRDSGIKGAIQNTVDQKMANIGAAEGKVHSATDRFRQFSAENFVRAMLRPVALSPDEQTRYPGIVNFERTTIV